MGRPLTAVVEVSFRGQVNGQVVLSIFHYRVAAVSTLTTDAAEQTAIIDAIKPAAPQDIATSYVGCLAPNYSLREIRAQFVTAPRSRYSTNDLILSGSRTGDCEVQNISCVLTKQTLLSGRSQIGSLHLAGISNDDVQNGFISGTLTAAANALAVKLKSSINPATGGGVYLPVLWHRTRVPQPSSDIVTEIIVQPTIRVMRRRTVGLGI